MFLSTLPKEKRKAVINDIIQAQPKTGNFITSDGKILGQHQGIWNFTIGQRRGLGISAEKPLYVIAVNKDDVLVAHAIGVADVKEGDNTIGGASHPTFIT